MNDERQEQLDKTAREVASFETTEEQEAYELGREDKQTEIDHEIEKGHERDMRAQSQRSFLTGLSNQILLGISQNKRGDCMHSVQILTNFIKDNTDEH